MLEQNEVINASICLSDIPVSAIIVAENGKKYLNLNINRKKEKDKYGYDVSLSASRTKEQKAAGEDIKYLGNGRHVEFKGGGRPAAQDDVSDLPF